MEKNLNLKQVQEFFSKPLEENTFKKGDKVTYLGYPAVVTATKEYNGRDFVSVSYDKGTGKTKASDILVKSGDVKAVNEVDEASLGSTKSQSLANAINSAMLQIDDSMSYTDFADAVANILIDEYGTHNFTPFMEVLHARLGMNESLNEADLNDPIMMKMRAAKDKLAKMRAANAGGDDNDKFFAKNTKRLSQLKALKDKRAQIMSDMEQEAEMEGGPIADRYGDMLNKIDKAIGMLQTPEEKIYTSINENALLKQAKLSGRKEMTYDQAIAEDKSLKKGDVIKFKNGREIYILGPKGDGYDYKDGREKGHHPKGWFDMMISSGKAVVAENKILKQAKLSSAEYQKAKKLKDFNKDNYKWNPDESLYVKLNEDDREDDELTPEELANKHAGSPFFKENIAQTLAETIKLGEGVIEEELCPKGKAYIKRRKAAGEKSSAYLSGRAVKVCKGQMSGRKKRKSKKK
jgi:hypothetical protein